ncbi:hypothetical protein EBU99_04245 [bacterium]|nr:hypothetical protein [bacterium]
MQKYRHRQTFRKDPSFLVFSVVFLATALFNGCANSDSGKQVSSDTQASAEAISSNALTPTDDACAFVKNGYAFPSKEALLKNLDPNYSAPAGAAPAALNSSESLQGMTASTSKKVFARGVIVKRVGAYTNASPDVKVRIISINGSNYHVDAENLQCRLHGECAKNATVRWKVVSTSLVQECDVPNLGKSYVDKNE